MESACPVIFSFFAKLVFLGFLLKELQIDDFVSTVIVLVVALEKVEKSSGSLVGNSIATMQKSSAPEVIFEE